MWLFAHILGPYGYEVRFMRAVGAVVLCRLTEVLINSYATPLIGDWRLLACFGLRRFGLGCQPRREPRLVTASGISVDDTLAGHLVDERDGFFEGGFGGRHVVAVDRDADAPQGVTQAGTVLTVALVVLETLTVRFERRCV